MTDIPTPALPQTGFLRLRQVLQLIPVCETVWYDGVQAGRYPRPVKLGRRAVGWRVEDIRALIDRLSDEAA